MRGSPLRLNIGFLRGHACRRRYCAVYSEEVIGAVNIPGTEPGGAVEPSQAKQLLLFPFV
jgi:hypothetical protein